VPRTILAGGDVPAVAASRPLAFSLHIVALAAAVGLWAFSLRHVDVRRVTDIGLVSVLPPGVFAALAIVTVSFCVALTSGRRGSRSDTPRVSIPLMLLHVAVLILMLYGITMLIEHGVTRFAATYKHVGITDYIQQTGKVDARIDAYFNWPGFFIMAAFVSKISGFHSTLDLTLWAPVFFNVLYLGPMVAILRSATGDQRLVWLGVWLFYVCDWVGQDYFSPQGLDFFLYLVVLAIVLTWFKAPVRWNRRWLRGQRHLGARAFRRVRGLIAPLDAPNTFSRPGQRVALIGIIVAVMIVVVSSHQLTPFAIVAALGGLVVFNRCSLRFLPVLCLVMIGTWVSFMTELFLSGHLGMVAGHVGQVGTTVNENVTGRLSGSPEHRLTVVAGLLLTAALWGTGFLGAVRSIRRGYWDLSFAILAAAPLGLILLQAYEGELVLRIYLFALPAVVFFAAALFFPAPGLGRSWVTPALMVALSLALTLAFFVSRYGNERMDYFSAQEIAAVKQLYAVAPPHSLLLAGSDNEAWRFQEYASESTLSLTDPGQLPPNAFAGGSIDRVVGRIEDLLVNKKYRDGFFIITRGEKAYANMFGVFPPNALAHLERALLASPRFKVVYRNPDATIFHLVKPAARGSA
jgi:hypothetical protein